jgi:hypothetical protein
MYTSMFALAIYSKSILKIAIISLKMHETYPENTRVFNLRLIDSIPVEQIIKKIYIKYLFFVML